MPPESQKGLIGAIVFAAVAVSASLVFLGFQLSPASIMEGGENVEKDDIAKLIEELKAEGLLNGGEENPLVNASLEELVDDDPVLGKSNAPLTLVEFSDYECPFCGRHFRETFPLLKKDYIDTGKLKLVFRDFPLSFHPAALPAAIAAECAREQRGDDAYFQFHEKVFSDQQQLQGGSEEAFISFAKDLGLNQASFAKCRASEERHNEVNKDIADGSRFGVNGTPGFVLTDGKTSKLISGAQPYSLFQSQIESF